MTNPKPEASHSAISASALFCVAVSVMPSRMAGTPNTEAIFWSVIFCCSTICASSLEIEIG